MTPARASAVKNAVGRFLIAAVAVVLFVGLAPVWVADRIARDDVFRDAREIGRSMANGIAAPLATDELLRGDPEARRALDTAMRWRLRDGSIVRAKIWDRSGTILYSDDSRLIGQTFPLAPEDAAMVGIDDASAGVTDLTAEENVLDQSFGQLVEVYAGFVGVDGEPLLFEAYLPVRQIDDEAGELNRRLVPLTIGALLVMLLALLPLALSLARRVDRAQAERARWLQLAVDASANERRRVAQDLHDGVIQDLAGLSLALTASTQAFDRGDPGPARRSLGIAKDIVRRDVEMLRDILSDIYPSQIGPGGLVPALRELLDPIRFKGTTATLRSDPHLTLDAGSATLAYRVVRESLHNVMKHAGAESIAVEVTGGQTGPLQVVVRDDGVGFDPADVRGRRGHLGLEVLEDTVVASGGTFVVRSVPGQGTTVEATLP